jgi:hypothetical protein
VHKILNTQADQGFLLSILWGPEFGEIFKRKIRKIS